MRAYQAARRLDCDGKYTLAIDGYDHALSINPKLNNVRIYKALALGKLDRNTDAVVELQKAVEFDPQDAIAHYNLGFFLQETGNMVVAIEAYRNASDLNPEDPDAPCVLGDALKDLEQYAEAEAAYRKALNLAPDDTCTLNNLALMLTEIGRPNESIPLLRHALYIDGNYCLAEVNLGDALYEAGETEEALTRLAAAANRYPDNPWVLRQYAFRLVQEGRYEDCIETFTRAISLESADLGLDHIEALRNLGIAYDNLDRPADAERCYRQALLIDPNDAHVLNSLGVSYGWDDRNEEAIDVYRQAIAADPLIGIVHFNLGIQLRKVGKYEEALHEFDTSIELGYDDADLRYNRGCVYEDIGRIDLALIDWHLAASSDEPDTAELARQAIESVEIIDQAIEPLTATN